MRLNDTCQQPSPRRPKRRVPVWGVMLPLLAIGVAGCLPDGGTGGGAARESSVKGVSARSVRVEAEAVRAYNRVNDERLRRGMPALQRRSDLDAVALAHARDLVRMNALSHTSSDGRLLEDRLGNIDWARAGENLARNKGYESPSGEAVRGWIASRQHHETMFRPDYRQTGMAALHDPDSGFTYFAQVFIIPGR